MLTGRLILSFLLLLFVAVPFPAYGYIDPGSGYMLIQILLAMAAGCVFYAKTIWRFFASFFGKKVSVSSGAPRAAAPMVTPVAHPETVATNATRAKVGKPKSKRKRAA